MSDNINEITNKIDIIDINKKHNKYGGGKNTNINGLKFEKNTKLPLYNIVKEYKDYYEIKFDFISNRIFIKTKSKKGFYKYLKTHNFVDNNVLCGHGCKEPDKALIDLENKQIYIIEEKYQKVSGSVCEKIQTALFKKNNYQKRIPNFNINYIYCLSDWFKINCIAELDYLKNNNIPYIFPSDKNFNNKFIELLKIKN